MAEQQLEETSTEIQTTTTDLDVLPGRNTELETTLVDNLSHHHQIHRKNSRPQNLARRSVPLTTLVAIGQDAIRTIANGNIRTSISRYPTVCLFTPMLVTFYLSYHYQHYIQPSFSPLSHLNLSAFLSSFYFIEPPNPPFPIATNGGSATLNLVVKLEPAKLEPVD